MNATPDYSKCSLRELRDVAARINREKYPARTALVLREIERREIVGDDAATSKQRKSVTVWDFFSVLFGLTGGALLGAVLGALLFVIFNRPHGPNYGDGISWGFAMMGSGMMGAFVGAIVGLIWSVNKVHQD